ncbi:Uncharacterized protein Fot_42142 [Forsythia ovata]|uniref:Uncharacterized protein n=1 Tax=Forsythia ovata TaxID=205694 RepID=A0ABD1RKC0_9LAMI
MYFGAAPENITLTVADTWAFRDRMIVSPGKQIAKIDAWMPQLVPPTRNHVSFAPKSSVACLFASRRGPTKVKNLSNSGSLVTSRRNGLIPISSLNFEDASVHFLCPGK